MLQSIGAADASDFALKAVRKVGPAYFRLTALPALMGLVAIGFLAKFVLGPFFSTTHPDSLALQIQESTVHILLAVFVAIPLLSISLAWMYTVSILYISEWMVGQIPTDSALEATVAKRLWPALASSIRTNLIGCFPFAFALIFLLMANFTSGDSGLFYSFAAWVTVLIEIIWIFIYLRYQGLSIHIVVLEQLKLRAAAKRSRDLLSGRKGMGSIPFNTLAIQQIVAMIAFIAIFSGLSVPGNLFDFHSFTIGLFGNGWTAQILNTILDFIPTLAAVWFSLFYMSIVSTFIYYQCRFRFEGYDIELLGAEAIASTRRSG